jgi:hypothetical protein
MPLDIETEADRPATTISAVSAEMIAAGMAIIEEYYVGNGQYCHTDECIKRIFLAMSAEQQKLVQQGH